MARFQFSLSAQLKLMVHAVHASFENPHAQKTWSLKIHSTPSHPQNCRTALQVTLEDIWSRLQSVNVWREAVWLNEVAGDAGSFEVQNKAAGGVHVRFWDGSVSAESKQGRHV